MLGVGVIELVTPAVVRGQWNLEQVLVRSTPGTRFASFEAAGTVGFRTATDFWSAGVRPGDRLNLTVDWSDRSPDGAYLVTVAAKL